MEGRNETLILKLTLSSLDMVNFAAYTISLSIIILYTIYPSFYLCPKLMIYSIARSFSNSASKKAPLTLAGYMLEVTFACVLNKCPNKVPS